ncbi:MAG: thioredoxin [Promethearchaeota archaeon]
MKKPVEVTDQTFNEFVSSNEVVVLDCWAAWCGPCRVLGPVIEKLAEERNDVIFGKLNVDTNRQIPLKYGIMSIPTMLYFKDGKLIDKTIGALPKQVIEERLNKILMR